MSPKFVLTGVLCLKIPLFLFVKTNSRRFFKKTAWIAKSLFQTTFLRAGGLIKKSFLRLKKQCRQNVVKQYSEAKNDPEKVDLRAMIAILIIDNIP